MFIQYLTLGSNRVDPRRLRLGRHTLSLYNAQNASSMFLCVHVRTSERARDFLTYPSLLVARSRASLKCNMHLKFKKLIYTLQTFVCPLCQSQLAMADIFFSVELGQNWIGSYIRSQPNTGTQQSSFLIIRWMAFNM